MKLETLKKGNRLQDDIKRNEELLHNTKSHPVEWIEFTFGNGSNRKNVCADMSVINEIKELLIKRHNEKIQKLEIEFEKLGNA